MQHKFRNLMVLLLVGLAFASCRDAKEGEDTNSDAKTNSRQSNNPSNTKDDANTASQNQQQNDKASITDKDNDVASPDFSEANAAAILLDCNYFRENPNAVLKDNPQAAVDYVITCLTKVDGKLTIEPGVVIAFEQGAGMHFTDKSAFNMVGTAEKPIILTGKEQTKGYWGGIYTTSTNSNNRMNYVTVDYAGGNSVSRGIKAALGIYGSRPLALDHCTFSNSKNYGMEVSGRAGKNEQNIFMENCTFIKNNIPFKTDATRLRLFNGTSSFSGNDNNYIHLDGGNILGDATWAKLDVPYFLQDNFKNSEGVLSVAPGTEIIMSSQTWMHLSNKASLIMVGTEDDPIIIRGEHDVAGFWLQLNIDSSSPLNEIAHVIFKNAGNTTGTPNGAVFLGRSKFLNIHDVVFSDCFEYGLSIQSASKSHLEHANLTLDNTPKLFSDWKGEEVKDPDNT